MVGFAHAVVIKIWRAIQLLYSRHICMIRYDNTSELRFLAPEMPPLYTYPPDAV